MKKLSIILASLLTATAGFAQDAQTPNRILVNDLTGNYKGFVIDNLSSLSFVNVEGEVSVSAEILEAETDKLKVNIKRSESCNSFKLAVIPGTVAGQLTNDVIAINYVNRDKNVPIFYQDFLPGDLTGIELKADSDYALVLVAIDTYGIDCTATIIPFKTPSIPLVGNPMVEAVMTENTTRSFTMEFTPNDDVSVYYTVAGEKGSLQEQYETWGSMFGFTSFNEMIASWGIPTEGAKTNTWKDMQPGMEYEVIVAMKDANGTFAPCQIFEASTLTIGGYGESEVEIIVEEYELADWYGEMLPSQYMTFNPNKETAMYRFGLYIASDYDKDPEGYHNDLCQEPPMPFMANWFFFEPIYTDYQIDPDTEVVAIAAGKNLDEEWGKVNVLRFTTPSEVSDSESAARRTNKIGKRIKPAPRQFEQGRVPAIQTSQSLKLSKS